MKIVTYSKDGTPNGYLTPIWNAIDGPQVDQVYLTVVHQGMVKGPHLHKRRRGLFMCIRGSVLVVWREKDGTYDRESIGPDTGTVTIPPGTPAALYNVGVGDAYVLNMPSPAWRPDDQDEHEVLGWYFTLGVIRDA